MLQQLMVDVTGRRFDDLMRALVLEPLNMVDSSFDQRFPHQRPHAVAWGHHVGGTPVAGGWRTIPEMAGAGHMCLSFAWPDAGAAVAVMVNSEDARDVLLSILAAADRQYAANVAAAPPGDVTGRYLLRDNYPVDIAAADGHLTLTVPGQPAALLLPLPSGHYRHPGLDLEIRFDQAAGQPHTMQVRQENVIQTASRSA